MLGHFFGRKKSPPPPPQMIIVKLNAKLQPMHRGEFFEDPLDEALKKHGCGEVSGGGTMQEQSGEIEYCDIEIQVPLINEQVLAFLTATLESLGAPKGSKLTVGGSVSEQSLGHTEGLAVYLNGIQLSEETYKNSDSNFVYSEFNRLLGREGRVLSYWQGPTETALYMYGTSFLAMKELLIGFLESYPLCQKCRVVQIA